MRRLLTVFVALVAGIVAHAAAPDAAVLQRLSAPGHVLAPVEGVWTIVGDDHSQIAVVADGAENFAVYSLDSPDMRLQPMTRIGSVEPQGVDGKKYAMTLFTDIDNNGQLKGKHKFTVVVDADGRLTITPVRGPLKVDLWMIYRFFITMSVHGQRAPRELKAYRLVPAAPPTAQYPVVL